MKWVRFNEATGELEEVDGETLSRELREADRRAGPSPTSRDWFRCGYCFKRSGDEVGLCAAYLTVFTPIDRENWECLRCRTLYVVARGPAELATVAGLTRWEWSRVRHLNCAIFGHTGCMPDPFLNTMRVDGDRVVSDAGLGCFDLALVRRAPSPLACVRLLGGPCGYHAERPDDETAGCGSGARRLRS